MTVVCKEDYALIFKRRWPQLSMVISQEMGYCPAPQLSNIRIVELRVAFQDNKWATISHLSATNWPLHSLTICDTLVSIDMAAELAGLQLPNLRELDLPDSGLTAAAVSELARADWPSLTYLGLGHDDLGAVAVLLGVDLDKVQELRSDACDTKRVYHNRMDSGPDIGLWPNLSCIIVSKRIVELSP